MTRLLGLLTLAVLLCLPPCPAPACSLCNGSALQQKPLREHWERAKVVVYGTLANPRLTNTQTGVGVTDVQILQVLKSDPILGNAKTIELSRYLPVIDPKKPPRQLIFCDVIKDKIEPYFGKELRSPVLLDYFKGIQALAGKDRIEALKFFFQFLDHEDPVLADDAVLEFLRSTDAEVGQVAKHLPVNKLRRWLQDPNTLADRLSLYAFLLSAAGDPGDARLLRSLIDKSDKRTKAALDGLLAGYIQLNPSAGWELAIGMLHDPRTPLLERFAIIRTFRFYYGWKPAESKAQVLRGLGGLIETSLLDVAVEDFRRWQMWDLTPKILAQFGKPGNDSQIVRRTIVRYALCCPQPECRTFIDRVRRSDGEMVGEIEEGLELERKH